MWQSSLCVSGHVCPREASKGQLCRTPLAAISTRRLARPVRSAADALVRLFVMSKLKSARHHWWPQCVSVRWAAEDGKTGWLRPDGACTRVRPDSLGAIGNGHHIKLGDRGEPTPWDTSFEDEFDDADNRFPAVISWLESLDRRLTAGPRLQDRFLPEAAAHDELRQLTKCIVSLAVRSPMNREASVAVADELRGPLKKAERNALVGMNMRESQRLIADSIGADAKFAVLFSNAKEFIFGDGFFSNVSGLVARPLAPIIVAPVTPNISVVVARPISYMVEPRLSTIVLNDTEVDVCNHAVQIYARDALFFRKDQPVIAAAFARAEHRQYAEPDNPMKLLVHSLPGVPPRDTRLDVVLAKRRQN